MNNRFTIEYESGIGWVLRCDDRMIDRSPVRDDMERLALDPRVLQQIDGGQ